MATVITANRENDGLGGHIASFASAATLYDVGFNHFFRGPDHPDGPDLLYIQGHCAPEQRKQHRLPRFGPQHVE